MENPIRKDDLDVPLFSETPISALENSHILLDPLLEGRDLVEPLRSARQRPWKLQWKILAAKAS